MSSQEPNPAPRSRPKGAPPLTGMPRWVKGLLVAAVAAALLIVVVMLLLGGEHGPGRHMSTVLPTSATSSSSTLVAPLSIALR